jgi:hypothetical protein
MSTILRALRRLEEEKAGDELQGLHDSVVAPAPDPGTRKGRAVLAVAGAGFLAAALGALVTWQLLDADGRPRSPDAVPGESASHAGRSIPVESPSDRALESALEALTPDTAILIDAVQRTARLAPVAAPPPEISSEVLVHRRVPRPPEALPAPRVEPELPPKPESRAAAIPEPGASATRPAPSATPPEPIELAAAQPVPEPESWREAAPRPGTSKAQPAAPSSGIPTVKVTKTIWHPRPERRSAVVEVEGSPGSRDLKEGDTLGALVLTEIKPSGVVFDYQGVELVRKIGESR